jgi:hypothetical protein
LKPIGGCSFSAISLKINDLSKKRSTLSRAGRERVLRFGGTLRVQITASWLAQKSPKALSVRRDNSNNSKRCEMRNYLSSFVFNGCKPIGFNGNNQAEFIFLQNLMSKTHFRTEAQTERFPNIVLNKKRNRAFAKQSAPNAQKSSAKFFNPKNCRTPTFVAKTSRSSRLLVLSCRIFAGNYTVNR